MKKKTENKKGTKAKASFSIDEDLDKRFRSITNELAVNRSGLIEKYIER